MPTDPVSMQARPLSRAAAPAARAAVLPLLGAALLAGTLAWPRHAHAEPVPTVTLSTATDVVSVRFDGRLQALRQSTLAAQVGGNVVELAVQAGERVRAGQRIARIDERDTAAALAAADAGVAQALAAAKAAKLNLDRTRDLSAQGFVSEAALDLAQSQHDAAAAGLAQARAARSQATLARGFATITAPFDAVVLATHVEAGDLAAPGRPLATVYVPGRLRAVENAYLLERANLGIVPFQAFGYPGDPVETGHPLLQRYGVLGERQRHGGEPPRRQRRQGVVPVVEAGPRHREHRAHRDLHGAAIQRVRAAR